MRDFCDDAAITVVIVVLSHLTRIADAVATACRARSRIRVIAMVDATFAVAGRARQIAVVRDAIRARGPVGGGARASGGRAESRRDGISCRASPRGSFPAGRSDLFAGCRYTGTAAVDRPLETRTTTRIRFAYAIRWGQRNVAGAARLTATRGGRCKVQACGRRARARAGARVRSAVELGEEPFGFLAPWSCIAGLELVEDARASPTARHGRKAKADSPGFVDRSAEVGRRVRASVQAFDENVFTARDHDEGGDSDGRQHETDVASPHS